jgi:NAD(P)-dependent dehydrogenase (short-subunit alcohol dehydrogenase family)
VVVADRNAEGAEQVCNEIDAEGGHARHFALDVGDSASVKSIVATTSESWGRIDILVHAAGVCPRRPMLEMTDDDWRDVLRVNLDGTFFVTREVAKVMVACRSGGTMVLIASDRGIHGSVDYPHYAAASKGGMLALAKSLALALGRHGITVNSLYPGITDTPLARAAVTQWEEKRQLDVLGSWSTPEQIAETVLFLAGTGGAFMTGQLVGTRVRHGA